MTSLRVLSPGPGFVIEEGPIAPPGPHQPTVEWQVCGNCNYDCSYCIQSKKYRVGYPSADELDRMLAFLSSLPGRWEIKMTGGEPFSSKLFLKQIIPALLATPHLISVLSNLSISKKQARRFGEMTRGRLGIVSASLHLEHETAEPFLDRLSSLRDAADADARFVVNCVLAPAHLDAIPAARQAALDAGFRFYPQLMKVKHGVYAYNKSEMDKVRAIVGDLELAAHERSANLAPEYLGRRCWTGAQYFVMLQTGELWSCRSARREQQGYMGNALDGSAKLHRGPHACPYSICPCAVPANRGMIEGVS